VQTLLKYAAMMDRAALRDWIDANPIAEYTAAVRDLARRIQAFISEDTGPTFTPADLQLLTELAGELVKTATTRLNDPLLAEDAREEARLRLAAGSEIGILRDFVSKSLETGRDG
jgi:hypothetical protein